MRKKIKEESSLDSAIYNLALFFAWGLLIGGVVFGLLEQPDSMFYVLRGLVLIWALKQKVLITPIRVVLGLWSIIALLNALDLADNSWFLFDIVGNISIIYYLLIGGKNEK